MRAPFQLASIVLLAAVYGCGDKDAGGDSSAGDGGSADGGSDDGGSGDTSATEEPVWTEDGIETSATLTGVYASGDGLYVVADEGRSWARSAGAWASLTVDVDGADLNGLWGSGTGASLSMVGVGDAGNIISWVGGGWQAEDVGTANFESVHGADASLLMAVGWGGLYSNGQGEWAYEAISGSPRFNHVWYNGAAAFAVGEEGVIGSWTQGGEWTVTQTKDRRALYGVAAVSASNAYAVGEKGTVLRWDGATWNEEDLGTSSSFWAVYAASASAVFIVGSNGAAYKYDGAAWTKLPTGVDNNLYAVHGSSATSVWAVGNRGIALQYTGG